jgi:hypothetical protein
MRNQLVELEGSSKLSNKATKRDCFAEPHSHVAHVSSPAGRQNNTAEAGQDKCVSKASQEAGHQESRNV